MSNDHWFKFDRLFELPKPLSWQGWACYVAQVLFVFLLGLLFGHSNVFGEYSSVIIASFVGLSIIVFMVIAIMKSNFRELNTYLKQM